MKKKMTKTSFTRRSFLRGAASAGAAAAVAPWIWIPRRALAAATPAHGAADHVLILYAGGGLRSAPLFHANVPLKHNPFGVAANIAAGAQWTPGKVLGDQPFPLFTFDVPQFDAVPAVADQIAVVAGLDHEPTSSTPVIDHGTGDTMLTQGTMNADAGLLTRIHRDYAGYVNGTTVLPPFDLGLSHFAFGQGDYSGFRPISIQGASDFTGKSVTSGQEDRAGWAKQIRAARDRSFIARRSPIVQPYLTAAMDAKVNSRAYAAALHHPALDLLGAPDTDLGGVTNQQLLEVLGGQQFGTPSAWGMEVAFALRLFQLGVPAVSVERYLYDDHSGEKDQLPVDAGDLGRQIAGLVFLLKRLPDAAGNPLWNRTMVVMMSEFSRDDTDDATGFNSAMGSDHQGTPASRNQIWPVFGGPVTAAGKQIGVLDPATLATVGGPARTIRSVHSTVLDVLGIDSSTHFPMDPPIAELFP